MFKRKITRKLFLITAVSLMLLVGMVIYVQLVVSRLYLTTEYTWDREVTLYRGLSGKIGDYQKAAAESGGGSREAAGVLNEFSEDNDAYYLVFSTDGGLINQSDYKGGLKSSYVRYIAQTLKKIRSGGAGGQSITQAGGQYFRIYGILDIPTRYIAIYSPVSAQGSGGDAGYMVAVTREVYTGENMVIMQQYIVYIFISAMVLAIILAALFSYTVTRPVITIRDAALRMANMDFSKRCTVKATDEIGDLAKSLNFLAERLDASLRQLYQANAKLRSDLEMQKEIELLRKDFTASVTHEFKTPLTLIKGYTEGIRDSVIRPEEMAQAQEIIISEVDKMDSLVQELLDLSKLESVGYELNPENFGIDERLRGIAKKYSRIMKRDHYRFRLQLGCAGVQVRADKMRIEQVVTNFISNALKNTPEGGSIALRSEPEGGFVRISVVNQGEPVPDEDLWKIWEKFYRTDKSRSKKTGGTGLGLTICKAILEKHVGLFGGSYGVQNTLDGVVFYFTLKQAEDSTG